MSVRFVSFEEASTMFGEVIYFDNACSVCCYNYTEPLCDYPGSDRNCDDGIFLDEGTAVNKQGPSKRYTMDNGGLTPDAEKVENLIDNELHAAETKHPGWPTDTIHAVAIMIEEAGEAMQAALNLHYGKGDVEELKKELAQTAAMAMRCLLHLV